MVDLIVERRPAAASSSSSSSSGDSGGGSGPAVAGVVLASGVRIACRAVVVTTGTFLRGIIHIGSQSRPAGRIASLISARAASKGEGAVRAAEMTDQADVAAAGAASLLSQRFGDLGFQLGRLKTGTPPRLDGKWPACFAAVCLWCGCMLRCTRAAGCALPCAVRCCCAVWHGRCLPC